jgi:signal transduction histidine kinase
VGYLPNALGRPHLGPVRLGRQERRAEPQKTKAQLCEEVASRRQQVADLIHDIKDPLGVILGYAGILLQQAGESAPVQWVHAVERINDSASLIHTLLTQVQP